MKPLLLALCLVATVLLAEDSPGPKTRDVGRFRLLRATVTAGAVKGTMDLQSVLKIDSVTGQTWILNEALMDGHLAASWRPVADPIAEGRPPGPPYR